MQENRQEISEIERLFSEKFAQKGLKQYGYSILEGAYDFKPELKALESSPASKIKEGDSINVFFWGDSIDLLNTIGKSFINPSNTTVVDNQGNIFVNGVGIVPVKGKTSSEAEKIIYDILVPKLESFKVKVNIAQAEKFPVLITGNVKSPGTYYINSDSSIIEIISAAKGVEKTGSLRNIIHISGNKRTQIDLYDFLLKGKKYNTLFKRGDTILVNPLGNVAALGTGVKRPAIYEFIAKETLNDIIYYAGGLLPSANGKEITIESYSSKEIQKNIRKISINSSVSVFLKNGDFVEFKTSFPTGTHIEVDGCVESPKRIPYKENMTLKQLLSLVEFKKSVNTNNIIAEISSVSGNPKMKQVYLYDLLTKNLEPKLVDVELQPEDKILFRELAKDENLKTVYVLGYVKNPGVFRLNYGMKISDAINLAGGISSEGYFKGLVLTRPSIREEQKQVLEQASLDLNREILEKANKSQIIPEEDEDFLTTQKGMVDIMNKKADRQYGRISINIRSENPDELSEAENISLYDGDSIYIPIRPQHVMIVGEVLNPSAVAFSPNNTVREYLREVGGCTKDAEKDKIHVIKANGIVEKVSGKWEILLSEGDSLIVPRKISKPIDWFDFGKSIASIVANTLSTVFIITKL